jgi:PAS domain S-box-containing protein
MTDVVAREELVNRISEIADVVVMRYRLEPNPGIEFVSPSSLPILGYRPDEFYETPALGLEIVHPDDRERLARECERDPEATFIGRAVRKDGRIRWIERRQIRVADRGRRAFLEATLRDVTAREETAEALRQSEERWQAVFDAAQDVFLLADDNRTVVAANAAAAELFGAPADEIVGRKVDEFTTETEERWALLLRDGSLRIETEWRRFDGDERRVRVSATANVAPGRHLAVVHDITDQRAAEEALLEIEVRFRTAFERAPIGMALVGVDGSWLEVNRSFCEFLGYSETELRETTWQALTHPDDLDDDLASAEATLAGTIDGYTMEKRYLRKDGETVLGRLNVGLVRTPEGEPRYFISQVEDITPQPEATPAATVEKHGLTQRQLEILQLLADGKSTSQVAEELFLSNTTVRNHIARLLANLGVHTRVQAVVAGSRLGLIHMPNGAE